MEDLRMDALGGSNHYGESLYRSLFAEAMDPMWLQDFSGVKRFLDELRQKGVRDFHSWFDDHPDDILHCLDLVTIRDANAAACLLMGESRIEDAIGSPLRKSFAHESIPVFRDELVAFAAGKTRFKSEIENRTPDGKLGWLLVSVAACSGHEKDLSLMHVILNDISKRKRMETSLRESEQKFKRLFDQAPTGAALVDLELRIVAANKSLCVLSGYDPDELVGLPFLDLLHVEDAADELGLYTSLVEGETSSFEREARYVDKGGEVIWLRSSVRLIKDDAGTPLYFMPIVQNVTRRKRAEEALRTAIAEKEVLFRELQHRVKNNLTIVASLLSLELEKIEDKVARQVLEEARERIQSMSSLYNMLSKSEASGTLELDAYLAELVPSLFETFTADGAARTSRLALDPVRVEVGKALPLGFIVSELVMNALKYAYLPDSAGEIRVLLRETADCIELAVEDDGLGLPAGFDIEKSGSIGLGLVKLFAEQIGGKLELSNPPSGGTRIAVKLVIEGSVD